MNEPMLFGTGTEPVVTFFTIVLDGKPWIEKHYPVFCSLPFPWSWVVVEGVADALACTSWCNRIPGRLSTDGTTEYLNRIVDDRVTVLRSELWPGKVAMCNAALATIKKPCLLWQVDADELWTSKQIESVVKLFEEHQGKNCAFFWCRYFVGPDVVVSNRGTWGNNPAYEWKRVWRFAPEMKFKTHEPPVIEGKAERPILHADTEKVGAVFDHKAYCTPQQIRFKREFYSGLHNPVGSKYRNLETGWMRLQENKDWPVQLCRYLPFVPQDTYATRINH